MPDPVSDLDVAAYLDGELDLARKLSVETWLGDHPDAAAALMRDLRTQTALRLVLGGTPRTEPELDKAARTLAQRLWQGSMPAWRRFPRITGLATVAAAALALFVAVPRGGQLAPPPDYVADAVMGYRTGLLRATMDSQLEVSRFDADEVRRSTRIRVPRLPVGWRITDVQLFPSDEGPALQIMIRTADSQDVSIFAVRSASAAPSDPVAVRHGKASVAYWRKGDISYALIGAQAPERLDDAAETLARTRIS